MSKSSSYTFPGLWPYIERAAEGRDLPFLGRGRELWHCKQVQDSLGQLANLPDDARRELLAHVTSVRESLAAALGGVDLALQEAIGAVAADAPEPPLATASPEAGPSGPARAATTRRRRD